MGVTVHTATAKQRALVCRFVTTWLWCAMLWTQAMPSRAGNISPDIWDFRKWFFARSKSLVILVVSGNDPVKITPAFQGQIE